MPSRTALREMCDSSTDVRSATRGLHRLPDSRPLQAASGECARSGWSGDIPASMASRPTCWIYLGVRVPEVYSRNSASHAVRSNWQSITRIDLPNSVVFYDAAAASGRREHRADPFRWRRKVIRRVAAIEWARAAGWVCASAEGPSAAGRLAWCAAAVSDFERDLADALVSACERAASSPRMRERATSSGGSSRPPVHRVVQRRARSG